MKKIPILDLSGLLLPVLLVTSSALADAAADLSQAEGFRKAGQYAQAEQAYLKVIHEADPNKPADSEAAFTARKTLPLVYVAMDRPAQAKDAVQQLLSKYPQHESLPQAIHEIVEGAKPLYKVAHVRQLYQDIVTAHPGDPQVIWLKMGMAIASVHQTDDQATDVVLQNVVTQHATDDRAVEALNHIAWACRKLQQYNKALRIYQYAVDNWGQKDRVAFSQHGIVICYLGLANRPEADKAFDVLLQRFGRDKNASKLILWAAHGYASAGEITSACKIYEFLVQNYPDTQEAVEAQIATAITSVQTEDRTRIEPAVQTLLTRFPPSEVKALGLHNLANALAWKCVQYVNRRPQEQNLSGVYNRCLAAIGSYSQTNWPRTDWAVWAERDLATAAIHRRDDATADVAIGRLITDYTDRKDTPAILQFLGNLYVQAGKYDEVEAISQVFAKKYPNHELAVLAKAALGQARIRQGDDDGAEMIFQKVLTDYAGHPRLAEAVNFMAEAYRDRAKAVELEQRKQARSPTEYAVSVTTQGRPEIVKSYYRRAIQKWEIIIHQLPVSADITPVAYTFGAESYDRIGDSKKALEYFGIVAERYPAYQHADYALHVVSRTWEKLQEQELATESQAWPMIMQASQTLLNRYPRSQYAPIARKTVDWITTTENRRKEQAHEQK